MGNLARRLVHELERTRGVLPMRERADLGKLWLLIDRVLHDAEEVQVD